MSVILFVLIGIQIHANIAYWVAVVLYALIKAVAYAYRLESEDRR